MSSGQQPFVKHLITARFDPGPDASFEPVTVRGLRATVNAVISGGVQMGQMHLRIWGMRLSDMNQLSTMGTAVQLVSRNKVTVFAGDEGQPLSKVYVGTVLHAWFNGSAAPNVVFECIASAGALEAIKPIDPTSFPGSFSVAAALEKLAGQMENAFENGGVTATLPGGYYAGTARQQAYKIAESVPINIMIDNGVLAIWPKNGERTGANPVISPETGMVGYPEFMVQKIKVVSIFNRNFKYGALITVQGSQLPQANGRFAIVSMTHNLASLVPGGPWFTELELSNPLYVLVAR